MRIVDFTKGQKDEDNFVYAICECTLATEGIEVPRKDNTEFINFNCPRCGRRLGIMVRGKKDMDMIETNGNIAQAPTVKKKYHSFYVKGGCDPKSTWAALNTQLDNLDEWGWAVERIDCHDNPCGVWDGDKHCYHKTKDYIILAYTEAQND